MTEHKCLIFEEMAWFCTSKIILRTLYGTGHLFSPHHRFGNVIFIWRLQKVRIYSLCLCSSIVASLSCLVNLTVWMADGKVNKICFVFICCSFTTLAPSLAQEVIECFICVFGFFPSWLSSIGAQEDLCAPSWVSISNCAATLNFLSLVSWHGSALINNVLANINSCSCTALRFNKFWSICRRLRAAVFWFAKFFRSNVFSHCLKIDGHGYSMVWSFLRLFMTSSSYTTYIWNCLENEEMIARPNRVSFSSNDPDYDTIVFW